MQLKNQHTQTEITLASEVWLEFLEGSKSAFSWLYHQYFNDLYNYSYRYIKDEEGAKDKVQDLFIHLWENRAKLPVVVAVKPYLLRSLRNIILNAIQKNSRDQLKLEYFVEKQANIAFSAENFVIEEEGDLHRRQLISTTLNSLPARRKEAVYLRYFRNMSYAEIASTMSLTEKAVINHIYKAFRSLRKNSTLKNIIKGLSLIFFFCFP